MGELDPQNEVSMICEVQLILNQYLHEKKRIHKLYSILRERTFFEMVTRQQEDTQQKHTKDIKELQFEPVLNVKKDVTFRQELKRFFYKCSVDSELDLLGLTV